MSLLRCVFVDWSVFFLCFFLVELLLLYFSHFLLVSCLQLYGVDLSLISGFTPFFIILLCVKTQFEILCLFFCVGSSLILSFCGFRDLLVLCSIRILFLIAGVGFFSIFVRDFCE